MDAYAEGVLSIDELRESKGALIIEKQGLRGKITEVKRTGQTWFEPAMDFLSTCSEARKNR